MVATPIGNLDDITLRALEILKKVDVIACEDTRHTQGLLVHFDIHKRLIACHSYNEAASSNGIVALMEKGNDIAYVSDAGTPGISDPGARVAAAVSNAGFTVVPVPGVSAVATLVSCAGYVGKSFLFEGFLSPKSGRRKKRLEQLLARNEAFVLYESPYRMIRLLRDLVQIDGNRHVVIGREMTKLHEEFIRGTAASVLQDLEGRTALKGEFALLVAPDAAGKEDENDDNDSKA
jgi:16S rRNA (cytidine1402-2'-O)-methyltransferase